MIEWMADRSWRRGGWLGILGILAALLLAPTSAEAAKKQFQREYTYRAGDDDSKNSARAAALRELRSELLREVGVYIESYVQLEAISSKDEDREYIREEIRQLTAGKVETKILQERWDGEAFYIEALVKIDPDDVVKGINRSLEQRRTSVELAQMRKLLSEQKAEIAANRSELASVKKNLEAKKRENAKRSAEVASLKRELQTLQAQQQKLTAEKQRIRSRRESILREIDVATRNAKTKVAQGMTEKEVIELLGKPRARDSCGSDGRLNYGRKWLIFTGGVYQCSMDVKWFGGGCSSC